MQVVFPDDNAVLLVNGETVRPRPFIRPVGTSNVVPAGFIPLEAISLNEFYDNVPEETPEVVPGDVPEEVLQKVSVPSVSTTPKSMNNVVETVCTVYLISTISS